MRELTNKLYKPYTRLTGQGRFLGFLTSTPSPNQNGKDRAPVRVLTFKKPCQLRVGDVVQSPGGSMELLMEHTDDLDWGQSFVAAHVNEALKWERMVKVIDPVSHMPKDVGLKTIGKIYATIDNGQMEKVGQMMDVSYRFLTGQRVVIGDVVGGRTVKQIVMSRGISIVECV